MSGFIRRSWRRCVVVAARRMPIESAGACMAFSVLFLLSAIYLLPEVTSDAALPPIIADALHRSRDGGRYLHRLEWVLIIGAIGAAWVFQARCLQICFPEFYDPYALD